MASVNKVFLLGNLGKAPQVRYTQDGRPVATLSVATTETWTDKGGNRQERTEWHSVNVWGKTAEACGEYLEKGSQVHVEGSLRSREYADKEGVSRKVWEVQADQVTFVGARKPQDDRQGSGGGRGRHEPPSAEQRERERQRTERKPWPEPF